MNSMDTGFASKFSGLLVTADQHNGAVLIANRERFREWERFRFNQIEGNIYTIQSLFNNLYATAYDVQSGFVHVQFIAANRDQITDSQKFELNIIEERNLASEGKFALRSISTGKWVTADQHNRGYLLANRPWIREWEEFFFYDGSLNSTPRPVPIVVDRDKSSC